jgi:hypothetical protein
VRFKYTKVKHKSVSVLTTKGRNSATMFSGFTTSSSLLKTKTLKPRIVNQFMKV